MKIASSITNQYSDFHLLNLSELIHHTPGRGPFMVTQDGCAPDDPAMRQCSFVLTHRGTWLHFFLYLALPPRVRAQCAHFETVAELLQLADSLPPKVQVEDAATLQDLIRGTGYEPSHDDPLGQALLRAIQQRHHQHPTGQTGPALP